jgi:hypothetical protein
MPPNVRHEVSIRLGDRNDQADLANVPGLAARIAGGPGDDDITGPGNKDLQGQPLWLWNALLPPQPKLGRAALGGSAPSSHLWGGSGSDEVWGGLGDDVIEPGPDVDLVVGSGGDDRIVATDGVIDYIQCDKGSDRLILDRWDFGWVRCGPIRRRGLPNAVPLSVVFDDLSGDDDIDLVVGCPADMPRPCKGKVTLSIRGGRRLFGGRFRVPRGQVGGPSAYLDDWQTQALFRRGARVVLHSFDGDGHMSSLSRVVRVGGPDGENP